MPCTEWGDPSDPHPQWKRLANLWGAYYPVHALAPKQAQALLAIERSIPAITQVLLDYRPRALGQKRLGDVLAAPERRPERLTTLWGDWRRWPDRMRAAQPGLALAVLGQARANGTLTPETEGHTLADLLRHWATRKALANMDSCARANAPSRSGRAITHKLAI